MKHSMEKLTWCFVFMMTHPVKIVRGNVKLRFDCSVSFLLLPFAGTLSFDIDVTRFDPGSHTLSVVAFATDGRFSSTQEPIVFVVPEPLRKFHDCGSLVRLKYTWL